MATFHIDPKRSKAWLLTRTSVQPIRGEADGLNGTIEASLTEGQIDLSAPVRMRFVLSVDRLNSGNFIFDEEMRRRLEARKFPTIVGETHELIPLNGGGRYRARGVLTAHGVTQPVDGEVRVSMDDEATLVVQGEQVFDVQQFNVSLPRILFLRVYPARK